jgi:hypothetical protein
MKVQESLKAAIEELEAQGIFGTANLCKSALSEIGKCEPVETLEKWLSINMPAGTVIGDPLWWARKIRNVIAYTSPISKECEPVTDTYVQLVPDKCDRIVYKNRYYSLDLLTSPISKEWVDVPYEERRDLYKSLSKGNIDGFADLLSAKLKQLNAEKG